MSFAAFPACGSAGKKSSLGSYPDPLQNRLERCIRCLCLILQRVQFFYNLRDRPILLALARVDVTARRDVVVVLGDLLAGDDARILLHFLPRGEGAGDADDGFRPGGSSWGRPSRTRGW